MNTFENQAMDYLLKPVRADRLQQAVQRLQTRLSERHVSITQTAWQAQETAHEITHATAHDSAPSLFETTAKQLHALLQALPRPQEKLTVIQASQPTANGHHIELVPIEDVIYFEAADKYVRVLTATQEYLIRTPLKDLVPQLDRQQFWQIHRSIVVRASSIASVQRDESQKVRLTLRLRPEILTVSRLYAHLFRAM